MPRSLTLKKRRITLKKKAAELSTLCGIDVAYVCFESGGRVDTWPEDQDEVKDIILKYRGVKSKEKPSSDANGSPPSSGVTRNDDDDDNGRGGEIQEERLWLSKLDELTEEDLVTAHRSAQKKLENIRERMASLEETLERRLQRTNCDLPFNPPSLIDFVRQWNPEPEPDQTASRLNQVVLQI